MHVDRHIAISAGWVAGAAFGVAMMAAPQAFDLSHKFAVLLFYGGIFIFVGTLLLVMVLSLREGERPKMGPLALMVFGLGAFGAGFVWYLWPHHSETKLVTLHDLFEHDFKYSRNTRQRNDRLN